MRYDTLVAKLTKPNSKRDILDVLEYQHMREKQFEFERLYKKALSAKKTKEEGEKKEE
jgi:hypothetical protein